MTVRFGSTETRMKPSSKFRKPKSSFESFRTNYQDVDEKSDKFEDPCNSLINE
jgi:hypothetical protein